jgi:glutamate dehydrogenase
MSPHDPLVALIRMAEGKAKGEREKLLTRLLLEKAPAEDLQAYKGEDLGQLVHGRMAFLAERKPGRAKIAVSNTDAPFRDVTMIDIVNDDMPFLVDSTIGLLTERGHDLRLSLHPVLSVKRDATGKLAGLEAKPGSDAQTMRESFMHFHIERISADEGAKLEEDLKAVFADIRVAVLDWRAMQQRLREAIAGYQSNPPPIPIEELTESISFLQWLLDNHFTFLGMREYKFEGGVKKGVLQPIATSGLGILRKSEIEVLRRGHELVAISPQIREFLMQPAALIITKSDVRATVHRRSAMDYIGVKLFDAEGELSGELRSIGLFTSSAYTQNPSEIPLLRKKLQRVVAASGFSPSGHSGKALVAVLEGFPRDELFQIDADVLTEMAQGILRLEERPRTRLFVRRDKFDRFVSAFVFIPRDRFDSVVRRKVGDMLAESFDGRVASFAPSFGEGTLVRVHFIILRNPGKDPKPDLVDLEQRIVEAVRNWDDRLESALVARNMEQARIDRWRGAFPPGYRDENDPQASIKDIEEIDRLTGADRIGVEFVRSPADGPRELHSRLYHQGDAIALGRRLPILENLGLQAISETTHILAPGTATGRSRAVIHDVLLQAPANAAIEGADTLRKLEEAFLAVWTGMAENDGFNGLVLREGLAWRDVALLRALGRYIRQSAASYSSDYMAQTLVKYSPIARQLVTLFYALFDPGSHDEKATEAAQAKIEKALVDVYNLDEDRIIRRYVNLVASLLRTNFFQAGKDDGEPPLINFKINSKLVDGLPEPRPYAEIFVYAPDVEAVHLRAGKIARGGIRWSDRPEDFRTEVLGLAKAQNVKNAVIVPVGAKGGFVPKRLKAGDSREAIQAEGIRTYTRFISSLLDITDNLKGDKVVAPADMVRRDGDDPYLVVAADKGTATFSDTANGISSRHGFWLDDAFASGGSAGYDHKKMGITARGGWEAVKRHFREMDIDIQTTPFTVIGVGDMSGDVFGNGMLLSRKIRLLAAFDHRDIFIDPEPDMEASFKERERLFALPRSSWQDYDKSLISKGGGVFARSLKAIGLSAEIKALTGLAADKATPQEIIHALLLMPADLLWFGGIGTYVKATNETQADAGDRANDALRVDASDLKVKVIGEGANLGVTQKGRIEFALNGGRVNTDAVDNSAGVNSSDIEVNIKIGLSRAEVQKRLSRAERDRLLADMTDDVAGLVLRNNYLQTLCLSLALEQGTPENSYAIQLMQRLEKSGELDRKLEALPSDTVVIERDQKGGGLTRPELAVLMAYAKISLFGEIIASDVPDDPYLSRELKRYFPKTMQERFADDIESHKLRREIIATMLANSMINRGGPSFIAYVTGESSASPADIAAAFAAARDSFNFLELNTMIDALDAKVPGALQNQLYAGLQLLLRWTTVWFLRHEKLDDGLQQLVERYRDGLAEVEAVLAKAVPATELAKMQERQSELEKLNVPTPLARSLASHRFLQRAPDIVKIAEMSGASIEVVACVLYATASDLGIDRLIEEGNALRARDLLERQAINRLRAQVFENHRGIVRRIVDSKTGWADWREKNKARADMVIENMNTILASRPFDIARYAVAQGTLADLAIR